MVWPDLFVSQLRCFAGGCRLVQTHYYLKSNAIDHASADWHHLDKLEPSRIYQVTHGASPHIISDLLSLALVLQAAAAKSIGMTMAQTCFFEAFSSLLVREVCCVGLFSLN